MADRVQANRNENNGGEEVLYISLHPMFDPDQHLPLSYLAGPHQV